MVQTSTPKKSTRQPRFSQGCWALTIQNDQQGQMVLSVPKRLLKQATRRNQAKRVARESWRQQCQQYPVLSEATQTQKWVMRLVFAGPKDRAILSAAEAKRVWRQDADQLLAQANRYFANRSLNRDPQFSQEQPKFRG
jgi:hypothetical protein